MDKKKVSSILLKVVGCIFILTSILIAFNLAHLSKFGQVMDELIIGVACLLAEVDFKGKKESINDK